MLMTTSVVVMWDQSPSTDAIGYLVSYTSMASNTSGGNVIVTGRSTTSVTLTDLEANTPYTITVQTDSSEGLSLPSDAVSVTTLTAGM